MIINENSTKSEIIAAINYDTGIALEHVAPHFKNDKEIVARAVAKRAEELQYASASLQDDTDIVYSAIVTSKCNLGNALRWASPRLRENPDFVLRIYDSRHIQNCYSGFAYAADTLKADPNFMIKVIHKKPSDIEYSPLSRDPNFICTAFDTGINLFKYLGNDIKSDPTVLLKAIEF